MHIKIKVCLRRGTVKTQDYHVKFPEKQISPSRCLKYLASILRSSGDIQQNTTYKIKCRWRNGEKLLGYYAIKVCT